MANETAQQATTRQRNRKVTPDNRWIVRFVSPDQLQTGGYCVGEEAAFDEAVAQLYVRKGWAIMVGKCDRNDSGRHALVMGDLFTKMANIAMNTASQPQAPVAVKSK